MELTPAQLFEAMASITQEYWEKAFSKLREERHSLTDEYSRCQDILSVFAAGEPRGWLIREWKKATTIRTARKKVEDLSEKISRNRRSIAQTAQRQLDSLRRSAFGLMNDNGETEKKYNDVKDLISDVLRARSCSRDDTSFDDARRGIAGVAIGVPGYFSRNTSSDESGKRAALRSLSEKIKAAGLGSHSDFYEMEKVLEKEKEKMLAAALGEALRLYPALQPFVDELKKYQNPYASLPSVAGKKPAA